MDRVAQAPRPKLKVALSLIVLLLAVPLAYGMWRALPGFQTLFDSFGPDVPWLSRLVADHPQAVWNSLKGALIHNATWLCTWLIVREQWTSVALTLATAYTWLSLAIVLIALYLPMLTIAL